MRVPVILVVPTHHTLRRAAAAARVDPTASFDAAATPAYPGVELDGGFAPVAIGPSGVGAIAAETLTAAATPRFALRGHLRLDSEQAPPERAGDALVYSDPQIRPMLTCGGTPPTGDLTALAAKLQTAQLQAQGLDGEGVAVAIVDTGVNLAYLTAKLGHAPAFDAAASWRPPGTPPPEPGTWPADHGAMCAFDVLAAAPRATLVDAPVLNAHYPGGGSQLSGTLSAALAAFGYLMQSWMSGPLADYKALVVSNSWGMYHPSWDFPPGHPGRYCDNPDHPFNLQLGAAGRAGMDVVFAAGNCGAPCADTRCKGRTAGAIMGASAMADVLTIAGCDLGDQRVGYSSQGPSIAGMYPQKPDVTGYTHFLGSEVFGAGSADSGTSAACPVVAGLVAALRTSPVIASRGATPPAALFDVLRQTARQAAGQAAGWNGDYGFGILQPLAAAAALKL